MSLKSPFYRRRDGCFAHRTVVRWGAALACALAGVHDRAAEAPSYPKAVLAPAPSAISMKVGSGGITRLARDSFAFIDDESKIDYLASATVDGAPLTAPATSSATDLHDRTTQIYPWGEVSVQHSISGNAVAWEITVKNTKPGTHLTLFHLENFLR